MVTNIKWVILPNSQSCMGYLCYRFHITLLYGWDMQLKLKNLLHSVCIKDCKVSILCSSVW